jgi:hypothetical protein
MASGLARPARRSMAAVLAALGCLAAVPDAQAGSRLTKSTKVRVPSDGNLSVARLELRASRPAVRGRGRISPPRLRTRRARRLPRDIAVLASVRRQARRGRFTAFVVVVNPARSRRASTAQDGPLTVSISGDYAYRRILEAVSFDLGDPRNLAFPNVLNANSPRAEELASQVFARAVGRFRAIRRSSVSLGPLQRYYFGSVAAARDRPIGTTFYHRLVAGEEPIQRTDVQTFRIPPGAGEGSRSVVGFEFNQPVLGVRIESLDGRRITTFEGASSGLECATTNPFTGFCTFAAPSDGGAFVIGQTPGVAPGTPGIELTPVLPPFQPVATPVDDRVVM